MATKNKLPNSTTLGGRLLMVRRAYGDAQYDLAHYLKVTRASISHWELGKTQPTPANVRGITHRYNIPVGWFLYNEGPAPKLPQAPRRRAFLREEEPSKLPAMLSDCIIVSEKHGNESRHWRLPATFTASRNLVAFTALGDLGPVRRGDVVFIDRDRPADEINLGGIWLVELAKIGEVLVHAHLTNTGSNGDVALQLATSDGAIIRQRGITVIGRMCCRITTE